MQLVNALHCICVEFGGVPKCLKCTKTRTYSKNENKYQIWNIEFWSRKVNKKIPANLAGILCRARLIISKSLC